MDIKRRVGDLIAHGKTQNALESLRNSRSIFDKAIMIEIDVLSSRFFSLQSKLRMETIPYEDGNIEIAKINSSILEIVNGKSINENAYKNNIIQYEQIILELCENYKSISQTARNASRVRKKCEITKFIADKLTEYPDLVPKFINTNEQALIGGIAYKIKTNPSVKGLEILKHISKNSKSNYTKGQIVNAVGEIIYAAQLRFGDDDEIRQILESLESENDHPLTKNIESVKAALEFLLKYGKEK